MTTQYIPDNMQAAGIHADNDRLVIKRIPVPHPGKGEVLIKILASPINPSDLARIRNPKIKKERETFVAGIEGIGTVVACGKGLLPSIFMGRRVSCSSIHHNSGTWAEYMVTSAMNCIPLPKSISDEQGSMMLVNPLTAAAFYKIFRKEKHKAIINTAAASSLGRFIDLLSRENNISVIHIVRNESQLSALKSRGLLYVLNSNDTEFQQSLNMLSEKLGVTLALDAVGGVISQMLTKALLYSGKLIIYGNLSGENPVIDHRSLVDLHQTVEGFYLVNWLKEQSIPVKISCILKARKMIMNQVTIPVQARFPLSNIEKAVETYLSGMSAGKVLLIP